MADEKLTPDMAGLVSAKLGATRDIINFAQQRGSEREEFVRAEQAADTLLQSTISDQLVDATRLAETRASSHQALAKTMADIMAENEKLMEKQASPLNLDPFRALFGMETEGSHKRKIQHLGLQADMVEQKLKMEEAQYTDKSRIRSEKVRLAEAAAKDEEADVRAASGRIQDADQIRVATGVLQQDLIKNLSARELQEQVNRGNVSKEAFSEEMRNRTRSIASATSSERQLAVFKLEDMTPAQLQKQVDDGNQLAIGEQARRVNRDNNKKIIDTQRMRQEFAFETDANIKKGIEEGRITRAEGNNIIRANKMKLIAEQEQLKGIQDKDKARQRQAGALWFDSLNNTELAVMVDQSVEAGGVWKGNKFPENSWTTAQLKAALKERTDGISDALSDERAREEANSRTLTSAQQLGILGGVPVSEAHTVGAIVDGLANSETISVASRNRLKEFQKIADLTTDNPEVNSALAQRAAEIVESIRIEEKKRYMVGRSEIEVAAITQMEDTLGQIRNPQLAGALLAEKATTGGVVTTGNRVADAGIRVLEGGISAIVTKLQKSALESGDSDGSVNRGLARLAQADRAEELAKNPAKAAAAALQDTEVKAEMRRAMATEAFVATLQEAWSQSKDVLAQAKFQNKNSEFWNDGRLDPKGVGLYYLQQGEQAFLEFDKVMRQAANTEAFNSQLRPQGAEAPLMAALHQTVFGNQFPRAARNFIEGNLSDMRTMAEQEMVATETRQRDIKLNRASPAARAVNPDPAEPKPAESAHSQLQQLIQQYRDLQGQPGI